MQPADRSLAEGCRGVREAALGFLAWVQANESKVRQERIALRKDFRTWAATAARLARAVERPMCVGVFGPSQSGKSYLISALARKGSQPLLVDFGGQLIDFVREINPPGRP